MVENSAPNDEQGKPPAELTNNVTAPSRNPYRAILSTPGALAFSASGVIARLPMSMVGIATILMVQGLYHEYSMAGRVSAVLIVAQAIASPQLARFVDRMGQRRVMLPMLLISTVGLVGLVISATLRAPEWVLYVFAAITGATQGSYGSMVRARWTHALTDKRRLHTAYSFESALDELVFVIGPVAATFLATSVFPSAGLIVPAVGAVVGGLWFLSLRRTEPPAHGAEHFEGHRSVLASPGMAVLILTFVGMGTIFGSMDISVVGFADQHGHKNLSGVILAAFAVGSLISSLIYGARNWLMPIWKRFVLGMLVLAAGVSLLSLVTNLPMLGVVGFLTGFAIAPTIVSGNGLVQNLVAPIQLTEGLAWVGTALGVGVSIGSWLAGTRIDAAGAHAGFVVVMAAGIVTAVIALAGAATLRSHGHQHEVPGAH